MFYLKIYLTIYFNPEMYIEKLFLLILLHEVMTFENYYAYTKSDTTLCNKITESVKHFYLKVGCLIVMFVPSISI